MVLLANCNHQKFQTLHYFLPYHISAVVWVCNGVVFIRLPFFARLVSAVVRVGNCIVIVRVSCDACYPSPVIRVCDSVIFIYVSHENS